MSLFIFHFLYGYGCPFRCFWLFIFGSRFLLLPITYHSLIESITLNDRSVQLLEGRVLPFPPFQSSLFPIDQRVHLFEPWVSQNNSLSSQSGNKKSLFPFSFMDREIKFDVLGDRPLFVWGPIHVVNFNWIAEILFLRTDVPGIVFINKLSTCSTV